jgi:hypothetical protein
LTVTLIAEMSWRVKAAYSFTLFTTLTALGSGSVHVAEGLGPLQLTFPPPWTIA